MNNSSRRNFASYASLAIGMALLGKEMPMYDFDAKIPTKSNDMRKCALPGCDNTSDRGYCCAAHCKLHKQLRNGK